MSVSFCDPGSMVEIKPVRKKEWLKRSKNTFT